MQSLNPCGLWFLWKRSKCTENHVKYGKNAHFQHIIHQSNQLFHWLILWEMRGNTQELLYEPSAFLTRPFHASLRAQALESDNIRMKKPNVRLSNLQLLGLIPYRDRLAMVLCRLRLTFMSRRQWSCSLFGEKRYARCKNGNQGHDHANVAVTHPRGTRVIERLIQILSATSARISGSLGQINRTGGRIIKRLKTCI